MRIIDIEWEGPFEVLYHRGQESYYLEALPEGLTETAQVYCIYGRHPVYGPNSLLYIGESKSSESGRTIESRLKEHLKARFWYHTELKIYVGQLSEKSENVDDPLLIKAVESMLIATHIPALNSQHIDRPLETARHLHVVNWGFFGALARECSGLRFDWRDSAADPV